MKTLKDTSRFIRDLKGRVKPPWTLEEIEEFVNDCLQEYEALVRDEAIKHLKNLSPNYLKYEQTRKKYKDMGDEYILDKLATHEEKLRIALWIKHFFNITEGELENEN